MTTKSQPLVSIVTPVYNEEANLSECIESILSQTYQNWEYTIVDNCSTDRSLEIARRYAARDRRIRFQQNHEFLEMIPNHNRAIGQISLQSKYCKVVLGDDCIYPQCLEQMVAVAEAHPSVGIVSAYQQFGDQVRITGLPLEKTLVPGKEACAHFLLDRLLLFGSQTSVMYLSELVRKRKPFYLTTNMYADFEVCFALLKTHDLGFAHDILTFSRPREKSIGSISADIGAHFGSLLQILFTYGYDCLSVAEFDECLKRYLAQYYRFLGRRLLVERDREFWSYHATTFAQAGIEFSRGRLIRSALQEICVALTSPNKTLGSFRRLVALRKIRTRQVRQVILNSSSSRNAPWDPTGNPNEIVGSAPGRLRP